MKISYCQPSLNYFYHSGNTPKKQAQTSVPSFTAMSVRECRDLVKRSFVTCDMECQNILTRIYNYRDVNKQPIFNIELNRQMYPKIKKDQEGLLLYAGYTDLSDEMNRFLSKRELRKATPLMVTDAIRVFDYSLKKLDDKYGKYSGIVYRQGFFPLGQHQYISTTVDPVIAATLRGGICYNKNLEFSIIKAKNGHKINEFQKKMGSDYAEEEDEILLSRHSKFREITNPQGQFLQLKNKFHKMLETYAQGEVSKDKIRIFEEI